MSATYRWHTVQEIFLKKCTTSAKKIKEEDRVEKEADEENEEHVFTIDLQSVL